MLRSSLVPCSRCRLARASLIAALVVMAGCRSLGPTNGDEDAASAAPAAESRVPRRVTAVATEVDTPRVLFAIEDGRPKVALVLRLDYLADSKAGATNLPACATPLSASTEIGQLYCASPEVPLGSLRAGHVRQECRDDQHRTSVPNSEDLALTETCSAGFAVIYPFTPKLHLEARD